MNDAYAEWLVKRKTPLAAYLLRAFMIVVCAITVVLALTTVFGVIALTVAGGFTYFVFRNTNIEFEYLFVTGQLSIDKIMGQAKRKKVFECTVEDVQIIAPSDSYLLKDYQTTTMKTVDYSSSMPGVKTYALISQSGSESKKVIFEPNDKLLQCFRQVSPRKVIL